MPVVYFMHIYEDLAVVLQHSSGHLWKWVHIVHNKVKVRKHSFHSLHLKAAVKSFCFWILWNTLQCSWKGTRGIETCLFKTNSVVTDEWWSTLICCDCRCVSSGSSDAPLALIPLQSQSVKWSRSLGLYPSHYRQPILLISSKIKSVRGLKRLKRAMHSHSSLSLSKVILFYFVSERN